MRVERAMCHDVCRCADGWSRHAQWQDQFDKPRFLPIFRLTLLEPIPAEPEFALGGPAGPEVRGTGSAWLCE